METAAGAPAAVSVPGGVAAYKRGRRPPAGEFSVDRVQESRRRRAARKVARAAPRSRRGMIRSLPFGVVFLSLLGLAARSGRRAAGRHSAGPARCSHRDIPTAHDPRTRDVSLATVTPGEAGIDNRHAIPCRFPEIDIKNGLISAADPGTEPMRAIHEWTTTPTAVVTLRQFPSTFRTPGNFGEPLSAHVRTVCRWTTSGGPRRRNGSGRQGAHEPGEATPRAVARYANPWLTFQLVRGGWCYRACGVRAWQRGRGSGCGSGPAQRSHCRALPWSVPG